MPSDLTQTRPAWTKRLLAEHPAFLFSSMYVIASIIGMAFSWDFLRRFGINVFNYAEIGDFMLASLKEPFTWGLVMFSILLMVGDNALSKLVAKKTPRRWLSWYASPRYRTLNYLVALILSVVFLDAYALDKARDIYAGEGDVVTVTLVDGAGPSKALLLGTTGQFLFLYQPEDDRVDIHPNEAVLTIQKPNASTHINLNE